MHSVLVDGEKKPVVEDAQAPVSNGTKASARARASARNRTDDDLGVTIEITETSTKDKKKKKSRSKVIERVRGMDDNDDDHTAVGPLNDGGENDEDGGKSDDEEQDVDDKGRVKAKDDNKKRGKSGQGMIATSKAARKTGRKSPALPSSLSSSSLPPPPPPATITTSPKTGRRHLTRLATEEGHGTDSAGKGNPAQEASNLDDEEGEGLDQDLNQPRETPSLLHQQQNDGDGDQRITGVGVEESEEEEENVEIGLGGQGLGQGLGQGQGFVNAVSRGLASAYFASDGDGDGDGNGDVNNRGSLTSIMDGIDIEIDLGDDDDDDGDSDQEIDMSVGSGQPSSSSSSSSSSPFIDHLQFNVVPSDRLITDIHDSDQRQKLLRQAQGLGQAQGQGLGQTQFYAPRYNSQKEAGTEDPANDLPTPLRRIINDNDTYYARLRQRLGNELLVPLGALMDYDPRLLPSNHYDEEGERERERDGDVQFLAPRMMTMTDHGLEYNDDSFEEQNNDERYNERDTTSSSSPSFAHLLAKNQALMANNEALRQRNLSLLEARQRHLTMGTGIVMGSNNGSGGGSGLILPPPRFRPAQGLGQRLGQRLGQGLAPGQGLSQGQGLGQGPGPGPGSGLEEGRYNGRTLPSSLKFHEMNPMHQYPPGREGTIRG